MKPEDEVSLLIYDEPSASLDPKAEHGPFSLSTILTRMILILVF